MIIGTDRGYSGILRPSKLFLPLYLQPTLEDSVVLRVDDLVVLRVDDLDGFSKDGVLNEDDSEMEVNRVGESGRRCREAAEEDIEDDRLKLLE